MKFLKRFLGIHTFEDTVLPGKYPYLVTGCARSGTHFMAAFLKMNGVDVGHEATAPEGAVAWLGASEQYCAERGVTFEKRVHLVRNPAKVMSSLMTINARAWNYIVKYAPQCRDKNKLMFAARYWIEWNKLSEKNAAMTLRLEEFESAPDATCAKLSNLFERPISAEKISQAHEKRDSREGKKNYGTVNPLDELKTKNLEIYNQLTEAARRYGYVFSSLLVVFF